MLGVHFTKAIIWIDEEKKAEKGQRDRAEQKRLKHCLKKKRKEAMEERNRLLTQVRDFLGFLGTLPIDSLRDHLGADFAVRNLQRMYNNETDSQVFISSFINDFVFPGNQWDLNDLTTLRRLQVIMVEFNLAGLYDDPADASPNATDAQLKPQIVAVGKRGEIEE